ncbi:hypothetical protein B0T20DRAFT_391240 [Sordaria brevicollis]|uniref:Uncharacterized protein n=1 Tax=Sordaria brevicollis TaxID=83679 RepID=A0AAE0PGP5_SORBR|nr:hypothetical protein B0T20DRAFT_391240 [Sordaria brevicollis]
MDQMLDLNFNFDDEINPGLQDHHAMPNGAAPVAENMVGPLGLIGLGDAHAWNLSVEDFPGLIGVVQAAARQGNAGQESFITNLRPAQLTRWGTRTTKFKISTAMYLKMKLSNKTSNGLKKNNEELAKVVKGKGTATYDNTTRELRDHDGTVLQNLSLSSQAGVAWPTSLVPTYCNMRRSSGLRAQPNQPPRQSTHPRRPIFSSKATTTAYYYHLYIYCSLTYPEYKRNINYDISI